MKYAAILTILAAMLAAGCSESASEQSETPDKPSGRTKAKRPIRIVEDTDDSDRPVGAPGFFSGAARGGRRKPSKTLDDLDVPKAPVVEPVKTPEPVKRPEPNLVKPNAEAERKVRLAKLYISNAASASSADRAKIMIGKASVILKEVMTEHSKGPAAEQAKGLLAEIEALK